MTMREPTPTSPETLRADLVDLRERVRRLENLLTSLYGPHALGGPSPIATAAAPAPKSMRPVAAIGPISQEARDERRFRR